MRLVSLEPIGPEGVQREKNFPSKWPVAKLPNKNIMPLMLLNGKICYIYILPFILNGPTNSFINQIDQ
jgi:hypothetical protein